MKKIILAALFLFFLLGGAAFWAVVLANTAVDPPPTSEPATNTGAWKDEIWQATGFYRLNPKSAGTGNTEYWYESNAAPATGSEANSVFVEGSAVIPQDIVITEWQVSGHVHFSSGM
jgi:hypothetical protein